MITKAQIKYIQSLKVTKFRQKYNIFIAEGDKLVKEILIEKRFQYQYIIITSEWEIENQTFLENYQKNLLIVTTMEMKKLSNLKTAPGIIGLFHKKDKTFKIEELNNTASIYLDRIMDPGNMGTIIRIADWFGFKSIITAPGSVDFYNPKVIQATMGSFARVNYFTIDNTKLIELSSQIPTFAAVLNGKDVEDIDFPKDNFILVIGNESHGISDELIEGLEHKISISNHNNLGAESLNAAVATAIICSTIRRK